MHISSRISILSQIQNPHLSDVDELQRMWVGFVLLGKRERDEEAEEEGKRLLKSERI